MLRLRAGHAAALLAVLTLVVPMLAVGGAGVVGAAPAGSAPAAPAAPVARAAAPCADVLVLGVGRGAPGWRATTSLPALTTVTGAFSALAEQNGASVAVRHLGVRFKPASALAPARAKNAAGAVTRARARTWATGVAAAVGPVVSELRSAAAACPQQSIALAGQAQGASVVHRVLARDSEVTALKELLVGAVLISDGDRRASTRATVIGRRAALAAGSGVLSQRTSAVADVPTSANDLRVISVCSRGDLVCDLGRVPVRRALAAHRSYDAAPSKAMLQLGADLLWQRAAAWPRPVSGQSVITRPDTAFSQTVAVRVGSSYAAGTVFDQAQGLPDGVTLSSTGVLSGSVSTAGSWDVSFRVRNTRPATAPVTGTLTIVSADTGASSQVNAGGQTTCQVTKEGTALCLGSNSYGQIGDGTRTDRLEPVQVGAVGEWRSISTSGATTCGIKVTGALFCWGMNNRGQLGNGGAIRPNPTQVGTSTDWTQVAAGWMHTCAVTTTGALWCWGENSDGQLGIGSRAQRTAPARVGTLQDWTSVTVGGWHSCGVRRDGSASCWGRNDLGQLGTGSTATQLSPALVKSTTPWDSLDATWSSTCGRTQDSQVQCWGLNDQGQLGDGSRTNRTAPVPLAVGRRWSTVSLGDAHACAVDLEGTGWCWGGNRYGQLGDGTERTTLKPVEVAGNRRWMGVDAGWMHTCALALDDTVQCWGNNERGQLARSDGGARTDRSTPPGVRAAPQVSPRVRAVPEFTMVSFNVLGSQHTEPGGGARNYAPGRIRSEWSTNVLQRLNAGVVAFQELQIDQYRDLKRSVGETFDFYPATTNRPRVVWQSVMWNKSQWRLVEAVDVTVPMNGTTRPNPMVRLKNIATGRDIWLLNVHNSARNTPERQRERNEALRIEIAKIKEQRRNKIPVVFAGDMNERKTVFCKVTGQTDLRAVTGGSRTAKACKPPGQMRLDWIFASPELTRRSAGFITDPLVRRITDHAVLQARLTAPNG